MIIVTVTTSFISTSTMRNSLDCYHWLHSSLLMRTVITLLTAAVCDCHCFLLLVLWFIPSCCYRGDDDGHVCLCIRITCAVSLIIHMTICTATFRGQSYSFLAVLLLLYHWSCHSHDWHSYCHCWCCSNTCFLLLLLGFKLRATYSLWSYRRCLAGSEGRGGWIVACLTGHVLSLRRDCDELLVSCRSGGMHADSFFFLQ